MHYGAGDGAGLQTKHGGDTRVIAVFGAQTGRQVSLTMMAS